MCKVISSGSIRRANERSMSRRSSCISIDRNTAQISIRTLFGTQTITLSRDSISKAGRGGK